MVTRSTRPTMRDVAALAGVSLKTVSRVVNDEPGVRPETAAAVRAAIDELGFSPDVRARTLRTTSTRSGSIGFVQVDAANPFFAAIFRGLEDVLRAARYEILAGSSDGDVGHEAELIHMLISRRVDGLVVVPSDPRVGALRRELERNTPMVFVDRLPDELVADVVASDHYGGARTATQHLLAHGHRRIAILADDPSIYSARERYRGYADATAEAGLTPAPHHVILGLNNEIDARQATVDMLASDPPTAIFSAQNLISHGAIRGLHELGRQHDIALVGLDDVILADVLDPGITVVPQDPRQLGQRAGAHLLRRIEGDRSPPLLDVLPLPLTERGSGEIRPSGSS